MSKVMIFSRKFPKHHFRAGEGTRFIEKLLVGIDKRTYSFIACPKCNWEGTEHAAGLRTNKVEILRCPKCKTILGDSDFELDSLYYQQLDFTPKVTTIRAGQFWKEGDHFSPRFWSGLPRKSKQIIIAGDFVIFKIQPIEIKAKYVKEDPTKSGLYIRVSDTGTLFQEKDIQEKIAQDDGLTRDEFISWFDVPKLPIFTGQRIKFEPIL